MNYLIAKVKRKREYFRVLSEEEDIFTFPSDLINPIDYNPAYKLEDDEWFVIGEFSMKGFAIDLLTKEVIPAEYSQITLEEYSNISYLCAIQEGYYYFQKLSDSYLIKKSFFSISNEPSIVKNKPIIIINSLPDAIYDCGNDKLYFKKLSTISSIFRGIDSLYKEATHEETEQFLHNEFIQLASDFSAHRVSTPNRKRIAMAMDTLANLNERDQRSIFSYIKEYCDDLTFNEEESFFQIGSDDDLKKLLYGIEQRYYTTPLGGEKRLANSVLVLGRS